jgi:flagellar biosynthesis/type III secretory pathway protein FliH
MMFGQPVIILTKPIISAKILETCPAPLEFEHKPNGCGTELVSHTHISSDTKTALMHGAETQQAELLQVCRMLNDITDKLKKFYEDVQTKHSEEIAGLAIEIARKILVQKIENGDYEIETIVKEALKNVPTGQQVNVYLHPKDLEQCQKILENEPEGALTGIKFNPDPNIGRAECLVKSPKGTVHSFIEEHLEQIGEALKKA